VIAVNSAGDSSPSAQVIIQVLGTGAKATPSPSPTAPAAPTTLAAGSYYITSGSKAVDGGFGYYGATPGVQSYSIVANNTYQEWAFANGKLQNVPGGAHRHFRALKLLSTLYLTSL
jgi:hypothetical protein